MTKKKRRAGEVSVFWRALMISILIHAAVIFLIPSAQVFSPGNGYIELEILPLPPEQDASVEEGIGSETGDMPAAVPTRPPLEQIPTQFQAIAPEAGTTREAANTILLSTDRPPRDVLTESQRKEPINVPDTLPPAEIKRDWVLPERRSEPLEPPETPVEPAPPAQEDELRQAEQRYAEWLQTHTTQFVKTAREPVLPEPLLPDIIEQQEHLPQELTLALAEPQKRVTEITPITPVMPEIAHEKQPVRPENERTPSIISPEPTPVNADILPVQSERFQEYTTMLPDLVPRLIPLNEYALAHQDAVQPRADLVSPDRRILLAQLPDVPPTTISQPSDIEPMRSPPALSQAEVRPIEETPAPIFVPALPNQQQQAADRPALRLPELNKIVLPPALQPASGTQTADPHSLPSDWQRSKRTIGMPDAAAETNGRPGERAPFGVFVDKPIPSTSQPEPEFSLNENDAIERAVTQDTPAISDGSIEGPAAGRQVAYKPRAFPEIELDAEVDLRLKFWVLPDGTVGEVVPLQRGDVRLEQAAISYLKQWRFNPTAQEESDVWGIVVIRYKLQ